MTWLAGDIPPTEFIGRRLLIPASLDILIAVNGALLPLLTVENWEQNGTLTRDESAALMETMFYQYLDSE